MNPESKSQLLTQPHTTLIVITITTGPGQCTISLQSKATHMVHATQPNSSELNATRATYLTNNVTHATYVTQVCN